MSTNRYIDKLKVRLAKEADQRMQLQALLDDQVSRNRALIAERDALAERLAEARFSLDGMAELCRDARDERDAAQKDAERFREIVAAVVREHPHRSANRGNAPGHGHSVPGVWDSDNGALAGTECAWCKTWNEAIAALQGAQP